MDRDRAIEIIREIRDETFNAAIQILKDHGEMRAAKLLKNAQVGVRWGWLLNCKEEKQEPEYLESLRAFKDAYMEAQGRPPQGETPCTSS